MIMKHSFKAFGVVCASAFTVCFLGVSLRASEEGARIEAYNIIDILANRFDLRIGRTYYKGFLYPGQSDVVTYTLYRGNDYYFVAGGCEDAIDVDLLLYDEDGNLISRDNDRDKRAIVWVTPRWTGTFYLKTVMYDATRDGAHWVLMSAYR